MSILSISKLGCWRYLGAVLSLLMSCAVYSADEAAIKQIDTADAVVFMPQAGASMTSVRMTIYNHSAYPLTITQVRSDVCRQVAMHATRYLAGKRDMYMIDKLNVKAGHVLRLTPNTQHLMLMGLKQPLKIGQYISLQAQTNLGPLVIIARVAPMRIR